MQYKFKYKNNRFHIQTPLQVLVGNYISVFISIDSLLTY